MVVRKWLRCERREGGTSRWLLLFVISGKLWRCELESGSAAEKMKHVSLMVDDGRRWRCHGEADGGAIAADASPAMV